MLPPKGSKLGWAWKRAGLDPDVSPVEDFLSTPYLGVSNTQRNSNLKDCILPGLNRPAKDVHPAFLAPWLQDCPSF